MKILKKIVTLVSLISVVVLASCTHESSNTGFMTNNDSNFVSFTEIEKEYLESLKRLTWPEGTELPTTLEGETADAFQKGYGDTRASLLWEYEWQKEWLATYNTNPERAQIALEQLEKALSMGYMSPQRADDSTRNYFKETLDKAKLGDPSGFEESIRVNSME